uniref:Uncharacterized protein n=1 Tax=Ditylenchus dipsaci TaxID=166011 RepID=A0A915E153_9BILA
MDKEIAEKSKEEKKCYYYSLNLEESGESGSEVPLKDETWSMCSSANNDLQDLDDEPSKTPVTRDEKTT